jgi:hypothetical protein
MQQSSGTGRRSTVTSKVSSSVRCCSGSSCRRGTRSPVMFPLSPFAGIWQRAVDHLLPRGAQPGQVVVEPDLINSPEAMLRAVAAGSGVAPGILGVYAELNLQGMDLDVPPGG